MNESSGPLEFDDKRRSRPVDVYDYDSCVFQVTISMVKSFLQVQPRGWNVLLETDVPFALPSDTRQLKAKATKTKRHVIDRRDFLVQIEDIFTGYCFLFV